MNIENSVTSFGQTVEYTFLNTSLTGWICAALSFAAVFFGLKIVQKLTRSRLAAWSKKTQNTWDNLFVDLVIRTKSFFILALALRAASVFLHIGVRAENILHGAILIAVFFQVAIWGAEIIRYVLTQLIKNRTADPEADAASLETTMIAVGFILKFVFFSILLMIALDNLGFNISALITGLGVGGIAIALAVQNILGDVFASLSIVLDKPFVIGDQISVGSDSGRVEKIGLKTTRLRADSGEQLIFSNAELLRARIHNFKRMNERRVLFRVNVDLSTPTEKLSRISKMLQEIVESQQNIRFDRSHLKTFTDTQIVFEVVYFVLSADFKSYIRIEEAIHLEIFKRFRAANIQFPIPPVGVGLSPTKSAVLSQ